MCGAAHWRACRHAGGVRVCGRVCWPVPPPSLLCCCLASPWRWGQGLARASRGAVVVLREAQRLSMWWCCGGGGLWLRVRPCAGGRRSVVGRKSSPVDGGHDGSALAASVSVLRVSWRGTALSLQGAPRVKTSSCWTCDGGVLAS
jgi:hypothetical protein